MSSCCSGHSVVHSEQCHAKSVHLCVTQFCWSLRSESFRSDGGLDSEVRAGAQAAPRLHAPARLLPGAAARSGACRRRRPVHVPPGKWPIVSWSESASVSFYRNITATWVTHKASTTLMHACARTQCVHSSGAVTVCTGELLCMFSILNTSRGHACLSCLLKGWTRDRDPCQHPQPHSRLLDMSSAGDMAAWALAARRGRRSSGAAADPGERCQGHGVVAQLLHPHGPRRRAVATTAMLLERSCT